MVLLVGLAQHLLPSQAEIMNALGMKQVYMIVQITKKSVLSTRSSSQGPLLVVKVRLNGKKNI